MSTTTRELATTISQHDSRSIEDIVSQTIYVIAENLGFSEQHDAGDGDPLDLEWWNDDDADDIFLDAQGPQLIRELELAAEAYYQAKQQEMARLADLKIAIRTVAGFRPDEIGDLQLTAPIVMSEVEMAKVSGLTRMTVRAALGK